MNRADFKKLLKKYLRGEASYEEQRFLHKYYDLYESEDDLISTLNAEQKDALKEEIQAGIFEAIDHTAVNSSFKTNYWIKSLSAAAAILVICSIGWFFFLNEEKQHSLITHNPVEKEQNKFIILPDGSTVIVSSGSKLTFPSSFDNLSSREVYLEGRAYFDIKHQEEKPFIVRSGRLVTTVLGTAFSVESWSGEKNIKVTVTRGKVRVADEDKIIGIITPDQQLAYNPRKSIALKQKVNADSCVSWKKNNLLFSDVSFAEAARLLEERFHVTISFNDEHIASKRFSTTFLKDENLEQVLKSMCEFNSAAFIYDKEKAAVFINQK